MIPDLPIYCKSNTEKFSFLNHFKAGCQLDGCSINQMLSRIFPTVPFLCVTRAKLSKSRHSHCPVTAIPVPPAFPSMSFEQRAQGRVTPCAVFSSLFRLFQSGTIPSSSFGFHDLNTFEDCRPVVL